MPPRSPSWKSKHSHTASATYLKNLRTNRPARPTGSRPLPSKSSHVENSESSHKPDLTALPESNDGRMKENGKGLSMPKSTSTNSISSQKGRPLVQAPSDTSSYAESTARKLEKQEAHSLRQALEMIDHADEENKIYLAAQMEAADLVWRHINPQLAEQEKTSAYRNPDLAKKRYVIENQGSTLDQHKRSNTSRSLSHGSNKSNKEHSELKVSKRGIEDSGVSMSNSQTSRRRSSSNRQVSGGSSKAMFRNPDDQIYEEPEDMEVHKRDPAMEVLPLRSRTRNSLPHGSRPLPEKPHTIPEVDQKRLNRYEIWKNPPSQSRKADYATNDESVASQTSENPETPKGRAMEIRSEEIRAATSMKKKDRSPKLPTPTAVSDRPGRPIVSFDPSWRPDHQSPRGSVDLERPPPIITPALQEKPASAPIVPTICLPDDDNIIPTINLPEPDIPQINLPNDVSDVSTAIRPAVALPEINLPSEPKSEPPTTHLPERPVSRPLPTVQTQNNPRPLPSLNSSSAARPLPTHTQSSPSKLPSTGNVRGAPRLPWLSRASTNSTVSGGRSSTVTCTACDLPISGRIVTASGSANIQTKARFHPECFTCHHCSTALECVSFYPEPESALFERLGLESNSQENSQPEFLASDLRFYCHLDYHDLYSPRCGTCKTPIEGLAILAVGKAYHEGHFFCAECGDPFNSSSPFVENKGYAYCVSCHTRRTSSRCKGCKKQILDEVSVEALGGKWHESCFNCFECGGGFGDEGKFFVRDVEVELTEKERRKGVDYKKMEERAVCEGCEGKRLKGWDVHAFL